MATAIPSIFDVNFNVAANGAVNTFLANRKRVLNTLMKTVSSNTPVLGPMTKNQSNLNQFLKNNPSVNNASKAQYMKRLNSGENINKIKQEYSKIITNMGGIVKKSNSAVTAVTNATTPTGVNAAVTTANNTVIEAKNVMNEAKTNNVTPPPNVVEAVNTTKANANIVNKIANYKTSLGNLNKYNMIKLNAAISNAVKSNTLNSLNVKPFRLPNAT